MSLFLTWLQRVFDVSLDYGSGPPPDWPPK